MEITMYMIPLIWGTQKSQIHRKKAGAGENRRKSELVFNEYRASLWEDDTCRDGGGDGWTIMWMYLMPLSCTSLDD